MKTQHKVVILSLAAGLTVWLADSILDYYVLYPGTFLDALILNVGRHGLYIRAMAVLSFVVFGMVIARLLAKRERTEQALRDSEATRREILDATNEGVILFDIETYAVLDANRRAREVYGWAPQTVPQRTLKDCCTGPAPYTFEQAVRWANAALHDGPQLFEWQASDGNGYPFWVEVSFKRTTFEGRACLMLLAYDITERKRAQKALESSEKQYRNLIETTDEGVWVIDGEGRTTFANARLAQMLGYRTEEMLGRSLFEFVAPGHAADLRAKIERRKQGITERYDIEGRRKDGTGIHLSVGATPITDEKGKYVGSFAMMTDVTERVRAEQAQRESEERYRAVVEDQTELICRFLPDFTLTFINGAYCRYFGKRPEELEGVSFMTLIPEQDHEGVKRSIHSLSRDNPVQTHEHQVLAPGGQIRWQQWTNRAILDEAGQIVEFQAVGRDITDRKQAEDRLRQSEQRYRAIVEDQTELVTRFLPDTTRTFVNSAVCRMFGAAPEQLLGRRFLERIPENDRQAVLAHIASVSKDNPVSSHEPHEQRVMLPNGSQRWMRWITRGIFNDAGQIVEYQTVGHDITERKEAEDRLRQSEQRYRAIVEDQTELVGRFLPDMTLTFVNSAVCRLFGAAPEQLLGRTFLERVPEKDRQAVLAHIASISKDDPVSSHEQRVMLPNGSQRWMRWITRGIFSDAGQIVEYQSVGHDITERVRAELALRASEARYRSLFEDSPISLWEADFAGVKQVFDDLRAHGVTDFAAHFESHPDDLARCVAAARILDVNRVTLAVFHAKTKDEILANWPRLLTNDTYRAFGPQLAHIAGGSTRLESEISVQTLTGETLYLDITWSVAEWHKDTLSRVLLSMMDTTARRRAEAERRALETKIQRAQKLESLEVLAGGIAHDFNNLLMGILGNAGLALMELSPESPARDTVQHIETTAIRAADLTRQLLAYSGKGRFVMEPISLNRLVEEMAHLLEAIISKKAVLKYNFADNLPAVEAEATQIRQVVMNLIINASEALGDQSGVVTITTGLMEADRAYLSGTYLETDLEGGLYVFLEVSDTGCGMDEDTKGKIFDPFFSTKFTSRGLGLAAVLGILRGHKGAIKVHSEPGRGSTFRVLLPCSEQAVRPALPARGVAHDWRGTGTVLVVDDEETVRNVVRVILQKSGFSVLTAPDGHQAVEVYRQHANEIVAVLLDMTMPRMSGDEAIREIRRIRADAPVILSSGYNEQDAMNRFTSEGIAGFIQKPYQPAALIEKMREVLDG